MSKNDVDPDDQWALEYSLFQEEPVASVRGGRAGRLGSPPPARMGRACWLPTFFLAGMTMLCLLAREWDLPVSSTGLMFSGIGLVLLGLLPAIGWYRSIGRARKTPEISREDVIVPANDRVIRLVCPQIEGRYEYRIRAVGVAGDDKPDLTFDCCLLPDMETLALYKLGKDMPHKPYDLARRVTDWQTFIQTGPGSDFALAFVNPHPYELSVHVKMDYYPTPALLRGRGGSILVVLTVVGLLVGLVGLILGIVGMGQWLQ